MEQHKNLLPVAAKRVWFKYLVLFIVFGLISIVALRHNNTNMIKLRDNVYAADRTNGDVQGALNKLQAYVTGHMNTDLSTNNGIKPPIQLSYTYARLQEAQQQESTLYVDAKNYCEAQIPATASISGRGRIQCITDYVTSHGAKQANIPAGLYQFDFISPSWSPDLAGWSLVATALAFAGFVMTFIWSHLARRNFYK